MLGHDTLEHLCARVLHSARMPKGRGFYDIADVQGEPESKSAEY